MVRHSSKLEFLQDIKTSVISRVSAHGRGLYIYLPKDVVESFDIMAGDKLEVELRRHWRPRMEAEE